MIKYISILRGINVGGHKKILMADLKELYLQLKFKNPTTYIQSGNVIFECSDSSIENIENKITTEIKNKFGFDVPVIVRSASEFMEVMQVSPFYNNDVDIKSLYITFLSKEPTKDDMKKIEEMDFGKDSFKIIGRALHAFINPPYHKSKLTNQIIEKKLNCSATTRNWKTVNKLIELTK